MGWKPGTCVRDDGRTHRQVVGTRIEDEEEPWLGQGLLWCGRCSEVSRNVSVVMGCWIRQGWSRESHCHACFRAEDTVKHISTPPEL
ncbi:hypothetical protein GW17_00003823 [Ensete ventricosum]|nr:hypothetical protein GW17_00003823 [Ensete ventricosum]